MVDQLKKRFASCPNGDVTIGENIMTKSFRNQKIIYKITVKKHIFRNLSNLSYISLNEKKYADINKKKISMI
tara:strand:+ start:250 stop:465 length:216 start_codon:yes stop_codon:yes gene_type:complete